MSERQAIYDEIYLRFKSSMEFKQFCGLYFFHPVGDALRLNHDGLLMLRNYMPEFIVDVLNPKNPGKNLTLPGKHFIYLARFCRKPYYIGANEIIFFDEEEAFIFKLCDGDIENVKEIAPEKLK